MSKFYGQVSGARSAATRCGHQGIDVSAQSYDGSVQTSLWYNKDNKLMVRLTTATGSSSREENLLFRGTFEELVNKFKQD